MKKIMMLFILLLFAFNSNGQEKVDFQLNENGVYETVEKTNFVVIPFEGKSAHEIYQSLLVNIGALYNSPKDVISTVEDSSISIRAFNDNLIMRKLVIVGWMPCSGYYNLLFQIKDGKVKVVAPVISEAGFVSNGDIPKSFRQVVSAKFKKGKVIEKEKEKFDLSVCKMNLIINQILGLTKDKKIEDNW